MSVYDNIEVELYLEEKINNPKYKSILYTDGVEDYWISRKYHTREHVKDNDYKVVLQEWLAKKMGMI